MHAGKVITNTEFHSFQVYYFERKQIKSEQNNIIDEEEKEKNMQKKAINKQNKFFPASIRGQYAFSILQFSLCVFLFCLGTRTAAFLCRFVMEAQIQVSISCG